MYPHVGEEAWESWGDELEIPKKGIVIVDFEATWCGPCKLVGPILEQINEENDDVTLVKVNVDEESAFASKYSIVSIPTIMLFKDGVVKKTQIGVAAKGKIEGMIEELRRKK